MRHGSLESGIGMFDYAAEMMGWENVFHCEYNPFCQTILNYYWPKAKSYANVFGFNGYEWRGKVDIISAGFPCQPFSNAGKRKGSEDDRHLWPENMRIFREAQPAFIVCENVPGLVTIEDGMVFEQVCLDLENEGYEVQTFIIPAVATNKDHRRDRIWIVAHSDRFKRQLLCGQQPECAQTSLNGDSNIFRQDGSNNVTNPKVLRRDCETQPEHGKEEMGEWRRRGFINSVDDDTDTYNKGLQRRKEAGNISSGWEKRNKQFGGYDKKQESWLEAATRLCTLDDGNTGGLDIETISKSKWRTESLKAAGNAIVWEIAFEIFKAIEETINRI